MLKKTRAVLKKQLRLNEIKVLRVIMSRKTIMDKANNNNKNKRGMVSGGNR